MGLLIAYTLFQGTAEWLGSDRGQHGVLIAAIVIAACLGLEVALFGLRWGRAWNALESGCFSLDSRSPAPRNARGWTSRSHRKTLKTKQNHHG